MIHHNSEAFFLCDTEGENDRPS